MITPQRKAQIERLAEQTHKKRLREQQLRENWKRHKDEIYFKFIQQQHLTEWRNNGKTLDGKSIGGHYLYVPQITNAHPLYESFQVLLNKDSSGKQRLKETTVSDMMKVNKQKDVATEALQKCIKISHENSLDTVVSPTGIL